MSKNEYFEEFGKPFDAEDVLWRFQYLDKANLTGMVIPYLNARAVANRLDEVVGQNRWKNSYTPWRTIGADKKQKNAQLCTIYIYDDELKEWIGKTDGAEDTDIQSVKGGLSDAFKRAAVRWNIGRYLYCFEPVRNVKAELYGSTYFIAGVEKQRLKDIYNSTVKKLFGNQPLAQQEKKNTPSSASKQNKNAQTNTSIYEIKNLKVNNGASVENSSVLVANGEKQYKAYILGRDERLKIGSKITNVKFEKMSNSYGTYNLIQAYDIAA